MRSSTRPPDQYMTAKGTSFRLIPNEYDKNSYGQCNYSSYRTLIRCKQIRSKEELSRNNGQCEEHCEFAKTLEENHKREVMRTHAENDTKMQRRRFDPWISSNEHISDEDDFLQAVQTLPDEFREPTCDNNLDNHPLRNAEFYTDKDVLRIKMDLVQKDIDDLLEFKKLMVHQAQKDHEQMPNDDGYDGPNDLPQRRVYKAAKKYSRNDYLTLTRAVDPLFNRCIVGPDMDDYNTITHVVHTMLDKLDNFQSISIQEPCNNPALYLSKFCSEHITLDRRQRIFGLCRICGTSTIDLNDKLCTFHLKLHTVGSADCPCNQCIQAGKASKDDRHSQSRNFMDDDFDDDLSLGNLSRIEEMVSPLQQFSIPPLSSPSSSAYPPLPSRPRYGSIRPSSSSKTAAQRVVANLGGFQHAQRIRMEEQLKMQEEELKTQTCARVRPIDTSQFGSGKKKQLIQKQQFTSPPRRPLNMPSILPNSSPYAGVRSGSIPAWRNSAGSTGQTVRAMHQQMSGPTQYPIHRSPSTKTITTDRAQEPKTGDELVEDRGSPTRPPVPEPPRRGVPYYKNPQAHRRSDVPNRFGQPSSSSPSFLVPVSSGGASQPPVVQRSRPPTVRPMAPHRAIAAGLNPGDAAVNPPRPVYRVALSQGSSSGVPAYHQTPVPRRQAVPPHRVMSGTTPTKTTTTSYTVVGSSSSSEAAESSTAGAGLPIQDLEESRNVARFANINVKTFLTMKPEELNAMTQEEIDLLANTPPSQKKKHREESSGPMSAVAARNSKKRKIEETIDEVVNAHVNQPTVTVTSPPQSAPSTSIPVAPVIPPPVPVVLPPAPIAAPVVNTASSYSSGEPPAKKQFSSGRKSTEKKVDAPKTPNVTSIPSIRTPRAAAVAANQAIVHQKPTTPSVSTSSSADNSSQEGNPLDLLAELSEAAAFEEQQALEAPKSGKKNAKKVSPKQRRPSSSSKKRGDSDEFEEEF